MVSFINKTFIDRKQWSRRNVTKYACGTMFFKNCDESKAFLKRWIQINNNRDDLLHDGHGVYYLMRDSKFNRYFQPMPSKYLVIFDRPVTKNLIDKRVIHNQASRRLKNKVK